MKAISIGFLFILYCSAELAAQYGVNDPALTERADILGRGEKVK